MNTQQVQTLQSQGFLILRDVFRPSELDKVQNILSRYHEEWKVKNKEFYEERAINSAYLTHKDHMPEKDRFSLFSFISNARLISIVQNLIPTPCFLNTQLFFDPFNHKQANYWHRDIQYGLSEVEQQSLLKSKRHDGELMPHFRIPLRDENGIELIPGSHRRWDTDTEFNVRTESDGARCSDALPDSKVMSLQRGDLLIFSAMMLHRGLYGGNRMALDVLYADPASKYLRDTDPSCLPEPVLMDRLDDASIFERSMAAITHSKSSQRPSQQS